MVEKYRIKIMKQAIKEKEKIKQHSPLKKM